MVENLPSNAGDTASIRGPGTKIPPATGQLKLERGNEDAAQPK